MYALAFMSSNPKSKAFRKWVTELLSRIHTGYYGVSNPRMTRLEMMSQTIKEAIKMEKAQEELEYEQSLLNERFDELDNDIDSILERLDLIERQRTIDPDA